MSGRPFVLRLLAAALALLVSSGSGPAARADEDPSRVVEAQGAGATEKAALHDALRNAVERAAGVVVMAESQTRDYELVKDRVRTVAEAFVTGYEVLEKAQAPDGSFAVAVRATVSLASIKEGIKALDVLSARKHDPSFAVVSGAERGSRGDFEATKAAVGAVNTYLQHKLLEIKDPEQVEALRNEDALVQEAQGKKVSVAQQVANRLKADVYVTVVGHVERSASVNVRFFESSTGRILGEESGYSAAVGPALAEQKLAVQDATTRATDKAFASLLEYWKRDTSKGSQLTVIANGLNFGDKTKFRRILQKVALDVRQLSATSGHVEYLVWTHDSVEDVVEQIYEAAERERLGVSKDFDPHARGNRVIFTFGAP